MADLTEELKALRAPKPTRHKLARVLEQLDPDENAALQVALTDPTLPSAGIARALRASGYPIGETSVKRYRMDVLGMVK